MSRVEILGVSYPDTEHYEGVAVYALFESKMFDSFCVFSRVTTYGSDKVMYPYVIKEVLERIGKIRASGMEFFYLQTHIGYPNEKDPGEYTYLKIEWGAGDPSLHCKRVEEEDCPDEVQITFASFIGC